MKKLISVLLIVISIIIITYSIYTYFAFDKAIPEQPITFLVFVNLYPYLFLSTGIGLVLFIAGLFLLIYRPKK